MEETNVHGVSTPQDEESMQGDKLATVGSIDTKAGDKITLGKKTIMERVTTQLVVNRVSEAVKSTPSCALGSSVCW